MDGFGLMVGNRLHLGRIESRYGWLGKAAGRYNVNICTFPPFPHFLSGKWIKLFFSTTSVDSLPLLLLLPHPNLRHKQTI